MDKKVTRVLLYFHYKGRNLSQEAVKQITYPWIPSGSHTVSPPCDQAVSTRIQEKILIINEINPSLL